MLIFTKVPEGTEHRGYMIITKRQILFVVAGELILLAIIIYLLIWG